MSSTNSTSGVQIGTHNGTFHCDEVLACCMLKCIKPEYSNAKIIRTRNNEILDKCDIVVDVGGIYDPKKFRFDHHQRSFEHSMQSLNEDYPWTIKLSSAGLVYYHFGHRIISELTNLPEDSVATKMIFKKLYENFIQEIDAIDNGIEPCENTPRYHISTNLSARVKRVNPAWNDTTSTEEECFEKAMLLVEKEFKAFIDGYARIWLPARNLVKLAIEERKEVHSSGEIVDFKNGGCPWKEHLFDLEEELQIDSPIKFVIYSDSNGTWRVQCVSISHHSFTNRLSLKEEWCGLRDEELSIKSGIPDCVFVHSSGFIGGNKTREGVIEMAVQTLNSAK